MISYIEIDQWCVTNNPYYNQISESAIIEKGKKNPYPITIKSDLFG